MNDDFIIKIKSKKFEEASILFKSDIIKYHDIIVEKAYEDEDIIYISFYKFMLNTNNKNAQLHYLLAELLTIVFNFLPNGYLLAYKYIKIARTLDSNNLSYKEFILLFNELPEKYLLDKEAIHIAREILTIDSNNVTAKNCLGKFKK